MVHNIEGYGECTLWEGGSADAEKYAMVAEATRRKVMESDKKYRGIMADHRARALGKAASQS